MAATATVNSKKQLYYALTWLITTMMLIVTIQFVGLGEASGNPVGSDGQNPPDFVIAEADADRDSADPSALYGGAVWTVTGTSIEPGTELLGRAIVEIDVTIENILARTELRLPDGIVSLASEDGSTGGDARFVDAGQLLSIEPGASMAVTVEFIVGFSQDPAVEALSLIIGEQNRIPAVIPLTGTGPVDTGVVHAAVDSGSATLTDPDDPTRQVIVAPSTAVITIDAGPYRAELGERLVIVTTEVQRSSDDPVALYDPAFWGLQADDILYAPIVVARSGQPEANTDEITLLFSFPETAGDLTVVAGGIDDDGAGFDIVVPR